MNRYVIGALALVGLTIILILILTGSHRRTPAPQATSLPSYANTNSEVSVHVSGPIVAPQNYNEANIEISKNNATFTLYQGYDGPVHNDNVTGDSKYLSKHYCYLP